ncbi:uncharacterized protein ISCGN_016165 [Ixodes scapularis]
MPKTLATETVMRIWNEKADSAVQVSCLHGGRESMEFKREDFRLTVASDGAPSGTGMRPTCQRVAALLSDCRRAAATGSTEGANVMLSGNFRTDRERPNVLYAEANKVFADTMVGFRPKLSTQDVMLRLYHQIMAREYAPKRDTRAILGLDISKAFDNVSHAAILRGLNSIDVGERIFKYIQNFLSSRQVQVSIGGFQSDLQTLGGVGTPQGAVLSPFLFNIAMKDLPTKLQDIPNLHHSIYADDVTLWMVGGSDGAIQDSLQEAIRIVEAYAKERGLACSQEKSELLLMAGTTVKTPSGIILQVGGKDVPRVRRLRILGLWLQEDGKNTYSIGVLRNHAQQVGRLIARIAGKRYGMKERNVIRLIKAFVISRIAYIAPFLDLTLTERDAIDRIIRCGDATLPWVPNVVAAVLALISACLVVFLPESFQKVLEDTFTKEDKRKTSGPPEETPDIYSIERSHL